MDTDATLLFRSLPQLLRKPGVFSAGTTGKIKGNRYKRKSSILSRDRPGLRSLPLLPFRLSIFDFRIENRPDEFATFLGFLVTKGAEPRRVGVEPEDDFMAIFRRDVPMVFVEDNLA